jgi:Fur family ferric uptake transcriptional regulator
MNKITVLDTLKQQGARMTSVRSAMVDIFTNTHEPLSAGEILETLKKYKLKANKTTVYREITFLLEGKVIVPVTFQGGEKLYELLKDHHHHLVCQNCHSIEEVDFDEIEELLTNVEKKMKKKNKFSKILHSLEFFGVCQKCTS